MPRLTEISAGVLGASLGLSIEDADPDLPEEVLAERRQVWRRSPERSRLIRTSWLTLSVLLPIGVGVGLAFGGDTSARVRGAVGALIVFYLLATALPIYARSLRRDVLDRLVLNQAAQELTAAEEQVFVAADGESLDLLSVWTATQKRLDYYHQIALSQSRRSFLLGQVASVMGFSILLAGSGVAIASEDQTAQVVAGILSAIGAALSAYIGSTFAKSQEAATKQLREYFLQPLELSRALAAERLSALLPEGERREVVNAIVSGLFRQGQSPADGT